MNIFRYYFANSVGSVDYVPAAGYLSLRWSGAPLGSADFRALYVPAHNRLGRHRRAGLLIPLAPCP